MARYVGACIPERYNPDPDGSDSPPFRSGELESVVVGVLQVNLYAVVPVSTWPRRDSRSSILLDPLCLVPMLGGRLRHTQMNRLSNKSVKLLCSAHVSRAAGVLEARRAPVRNRNRMPAKKVHLLSMVSETSCALYLCYVALRWGARFCVPETSISFDGLWVKLACVYKYDSDFECSMFSPSQANRTLPHWRIFAIHLKCSLALRR